MKRFYRFPKIVDDRGVLTVIENHDLPFEPKRVFFIQDVPIGKKRAGHGHKETLQLILPVKGTVALHIKGDEGYVTHYLWEQYRGVMVFPGEIITLRHFSEDAIIMVIASQPYDKEDFIYETDTVQ